MRGKHVRRNRSRILPFTALFGIYLLICGVVIAAGPNFINYRASLSDTLGNPVVDSTYTVHFSIYKLETGGTAVWTEEHSVMTKNGTFRVKLGSNTALHDSVFNDSLRWLGIRVEPDPEMEPRSVIGTVPWAINAAFADKVKDKSVGKGQLKDKAVGKDQLDTAAVDTDKIKSKAVGREHLKDKSVGKDQLDSLAVDTDKIKGKAVGREQLKDKSVGKDQLDSLAVDTDKIKGKAVGRAQLKDRAVGKDQLDSLAVTKEKINNGAVGFKKIAQEGALAGQVIKWTGSQWVAANDSVDSGPDTDWTLSGSVLFTDGGLGVARSGNTLYGNEDSTHTNLGTSSTTGALGFDYRYATVSGGVGNSATGEASTVTGGENNMASGANAFVGGGRSNNAIGYASTVGGGENNAVSDDYATVGGGYANSATDQYATVGGGNDNQATAAAATIAGGQSNRAQGLYTTIGGGDGNKATEEGATVGGGKSNEASGYWSIVAGGQSNRATAEAATVGGGEFNVSAGTASTVSGGSGNRAEQEYATVPGGKDNAARGVASIAAGVNAKANHDGAVVIAASPVSVTSDSIASGDDSQMVLRADGRFFLTDGPGTASIPGSRFLNTSTGAYLSSGGNWMNSSDENLKENFTPLDREEILAKIADLDITRWKYKKDEAGVEHIGPTAQEFYALFGLGADEETISTIDPAGIALAAIQGLYEKTIELEKTSAEAEELKRRVDELSSQVERLIALLEKSNARKEKRVNAGGNDE